MIIFVVVFSPFLFSLAAISWLVTSPTASVFAFSRGLFENDGGDREEKTAACEVETGAP